MSSDAVVGRGSCRETSSSMPTVNRRLGPLAAELVEDAGDHARGELLRGQPVAAADHARHRLALAVGVRLG